MPITPCPNNCRGINYVQVSHAYTEPGTYSVNMTAAWSQGSTYLEDSAESTVIIYTVNPLTVDAGGPYESAAGGIVHFLGSANLSGQQGVIQYTCTWNWQDGSSTQTGQNLFTPTHKFISPGTYIIELEVLAYNDGHFVSQATDTAPVTVSQNPYNMTNQTGLGTIGAFDVISSLARIYKGGPM